MVQSVGGLNAKQIGTVAEIQSGNRGERFEVVHATTIQFGQATI